MALPDPPVVDPARVRSLPPHFAWIDHRLRDRLAELELEEIPLLLFLHLAADRHGCSFWSDRAVARKLRMSEGRILEAREALIAKGLIAYRYPLYQLLPLSDAPRQEASP